MHRVFNNRDETRFDFSHMGNKAPARARSALEDSRSLARRLPVLLSMSRSRQRTTCFAGCLLVLVGRVSAIPAREISPPVWPAHASANCEPYSPAFVLVWLVIFEPLGEYYHFENSMDFFSTVAVNCAVSEETSPEALDLCDW